MASTPEVLVKNKIKKLLHKYTVYYTMPIGSGYGNSGTPDILCCLNGHFIGIEAKAGNNKPTALQEKHLRAIQSAGGSALVIREDNLHVLEALLERLNGRSS